MKEARGQQWNKLPEISWNATMKIIIQHTFDGILPEAWKQAEQGIRREKKNSYAIFYAVYTLCHEVERLDPFSRFSAFLI